MRILTKILIFDENIDFFAEFWVLTEMLIFAENTPIYEYTPSPRIKGRATTFCRKNWTGDKLVGV